MKLKLWKRPRTGTKSYEFVWKQPMNPSAFQALKL